jgi:hypothetical protein
MSCARAAVATAHRGYSIVDPFNNPAQRMFAVIFAFAMRSPMLP